MSEDLFAQLIALTSGLLLISGVLIVWRRTLMSDVRLLAMQGLALAGLAFVIAIDEGAFELIGVALLVAVLKGVVMPLLLLRAVAKSGGLREEQPTIGTNAALITIALLTALAYLVSAPFTAGQAGPAVASVSVGVALVLYGFFTLTTRKHAVSQLVGYLMLDNGIATIAFMLAGGAPLLVELGVSLDVLLVVVILQVLTSRISSEFGAADLDDLRELRD